MKTGSTEARMARTSLGIPYSHVVVGAEVRTCARCETARFVLHEQRASNRVHSTRKEIRYMRRTTSLLLVLSIAILMSGVTGCGSLGLEDTAMDDNIPIQTAEQAVCPTCNGCNGIDPA